MPTAKVAIYQPLQAQKGELGDQCKCQPLTSSHIHPRPGAMRSGCSAAKCRRNFSYLRPFAEASNYRALRTRDTGDVLNLGSGGTRETHNLPRFWGWTWLVNLPCLGSPPNQWARFQGTHESVRELAKRVRALARHKGQGNQIPQIQEVLKKDILQPTVYQQQLCTGSLSSFLPVS